MRPDDVSRLTTLRSASQPNMVWLLVETADGATGLGETYGSPGAVEAYVHDTAAPYLLGQRAGDIERHWWTLYEAWGPSGIGVESRGLSMVDVALWDLLARRLGVPLVDLFGGPVRDEVRAYNTCGGPDYGRDAVVPGSPSVPPEHAADRYDDLYLQRHEPAELARSLLEMGFGAMKIWPFDAVAEARGDDTIDADGLREGLAPVAAIRDAVGDRIEVALELHSRWDLPSAIRIARATEPYEPRWFEDPVRSDSIASLGAFAASTRIPTVAGENLGTFPAFRDLVESTPVRIVMADPSYAGGITACRRIADLAGSHHKAFTTHDASGPVNLAVGVQLNLHHENAIAQEMVRAYSFGWYPEHVTGLPEFRNGALLPHHRTGHGVELRAELTASDGMTTRVSTD
jgi:L-alanine-DL-glutamate epimerase-like enolase superfamily enzyme